MDEDGFTKVVSGITRTPDGLTMRGAPRPAVRLGAFAETAPKKAAKKKKSKDSGELSGG